MLERGDRAPEFEGLAESDDRVSLLSFRGQVVILYFYPKDNTPGCTRQACAFRDSFKLLQKKDVAIVGVSPDSPDSHDKFKSKFNLPFPLLSDPSHKVAEAYGVWKEKSMYGRKFMGVERSTFIINREGKIDAIYRKVKVDGHIEHLLGAL